MYELKLLRFIFNYFYGLAVLLPSKWFSLSSKFSQNMSWLSDAVHNKYLKWVGIQISNIYLKKWFMATTLSFPVAPSLNLSESSKRLISFSSLFYLIELSSFSNNCYLPKTNPVNYFNINYYLNIFNLNLWFSYLQFDYVN